MEIGIIGVSGSIGRQSVKIITDNPNLFSLSAISVYSQNDYVIELLKIFPIKVVATNLEVDAILLRQQFPDIQVYSGPEGLIKVAT